MIIFCQCYHNTVQSECSTGSNVSMHFFVYPLVVATTTFWMSVVNVDDVVSILAELDMAGFLDLAKVFDCVNHDNYSVRQVGSLWCCG